MESQAAIHQKPPPSEVATAWALHPGSLWGEPNATPVWEAEDSYAAAAAAGMATPAQLYDHGCYLLLHRAKLLPCHARMVRSTARILGCEEQIVLGALICTRHASGNASSVHRWVAAVLFVAAQLGHHVPQWRMEKWLRNYQPNDFEEEDMEEVLWPEDQHVSSLFRQPQPCEDAAHEEVACDGDTAPSSPFSPLDVLATQDSTALTDASDEGPAADPMSVAAACEDAPAADPVAVAAAACEDAPAADPVAVAAASNKGAGRCVTLFHKLRGAMAVSLGGKEARQEPQAAIKAQATSAEAKDKADEAKTEAALAAAPAPETAACAMHEQGSGAGFFCWGRLFRGGDRQGGYKQPEACAASDESAVGAAAAPQPQPKCGGTLRRLFKLGAQLVVKVFTQLLRSARRSGI